MKDGTCVFFPASYLVSPSRRAKFLRAGARMHTLGGSSAWSVELTPVRYPGSEGLPRLEHNI